MAMGPDERLVRFSEDEVARLIQLYTDAEREILNEINRALLRGNRIEYLQAMLANVQAILEDLRNGSRTWCEEAIPRIYIEGTQFADQQLKQAGIKVAAGFGAIHQQAAQVLAETAYNRFDEVAITIGRRVDDIYRTLALENIRGSVIGYKTWQQVAKSYREQLAERGVTGFKDAAGRKWNMRSYSEMVARTTTMEAHLQGTANRLLEHGHDLVKVSTHLGPCEKCQPWQGKILSLTGRTPGYPTLQEAKNEGLFHPRCRHAYGLYIDFDQEIEKLEDELQEGREPGKIEKRPSVKPSITDAFKELGAYGLLGELYGGEVPEQRIRRLVKEGKMSAEAVVAAKSFWESRLQEPVEDPRGVEIIVTIDDLYHLIVDPRIWRRPERIEKILTSVVEVVESKIPGFEILISEWEEDGKKIYAYAVLSPDKTVKTAHLVDEKKIRQLKKEANVLWSK